MMRQPKRLTLLQVDVLTTIRNLSHLHGYPPTISELSIALGKARGTITDHLDALKRKGVLRSKPRSARSLEILQAA